MPQGRTKHVPLRSCVVCRRTRPQAELLRFYKDALGVWRFDPTGKGGGRGSWLCKDEPECHHVKKLRRHFRNDAASIGLHLQALEHAAVKGG